MRGVEQCLPHEEPGVYVHVSPELKALLMQIDLGERIPPELYRAVAEILVWVTQLDRGHEAAVPLR